ncbi:MAG: DUF2336 domain-containing protein [Bradyrhizobium sp.]
MTEPQVNLHNNLIDQLEDAVSGKSIGRRADVLKRITDLFLQGSGKYTEPQIDLFDAVLSRLVDTVEVASRAEFGNRLADMSDAPKGVVRLLAFDKAIEVAAPILTRSERLSEADLIRNAETMSQEHLLAISKRRELKEGVTDVLVSRGDHEVLVSTATNRGSRFSAPGLDRLVEKAGSDDRLALSVWSRPDIPRQQMVRLFQQASDELRLQLEAAHPRHANSIRAAVSIAAERVQAIARAGSAQSRAASATLRELHAKGSLNEATLLQLVEENNFDGVATALSLLCDLPIGTVERALSRGRYEQILLFAKALQLSWQTTLALIRFQAGNTTVAQTDADRHFASYSRMQVKTALTALQFYRMREHASRSQL